MFKGIKTFFDRMDKATFWASASVAFIIYIISLGPSIGLEDAGELAVAADGPGVPHPPGYPLWTLFSWGLCRLFGWVTYYGYPNAAWAVALGSAIAGALAAGVLGMLISRSGRDLIGDTRGFIGLLAGVGGSLAFAFSPVMWSQSVIVEVYALGALFLALVMLLAYRWLMLRERWALVVLGLVFGLGLTNYQVLLLAGLPLAFLVLCRRWRLGLSFIMLGIPIALTIYDLTLGAITSANGLSTPGDPVILRPLAAATAEAPLLAIAPGWTYVTLGIGLVLVLIGLYYRWRWWTLICGLGVAGVLIITLRLYGGGVLPTDFRGTLYPFWHAWGIHILLYGVLLAIAWRYRRTRRFAWGVIIVQSVVLALLNGGLMYGLTDPNTWWFWWPIVWLVGLLILAQRCLCQGGRVALTVLMCALGLAVYGYMPLVSDLLNPGMNWGYARTWEGFKHAISRGQYESISPTSFFSLTYLQQLWGYVEDLRMQFSLPVIGLGIVGLVAFVRKGWKWRGCWLVSTVILFLTMSAVLIALANPRGDIQDGFIQKVKFISSHGIYALWIGYGVLAVGQWLVMHCRRGGYAVLGGLALVVVAAPIAENCFNARLVMAMGAAEQTGHDFGWQYGADMLEGARAIRQQLNADEEPLPDPFWPPPMASNAVYFGGTDPGRFVPTYMVYSVKLRPDIKVLTQNALADATYMNVERDLYGDELWLPTANQVQQAFVSYVNAVQSGQRASNGAIAESNGRMQITGATAIMEINADLSKQIYDYNAERAFYVEESYPVAWMTPKLQPAGLAMRIMPGEKADLEVTLDRDRDFWDWMTRRLSVKTAYRRDFAAQKSFSKLRTAIAGVYASRGMPQAALTAFTEALVLYPISPEVIFRYVKESLLQRMEIETALRVLRNYYQLDPNNLRANELIERLEEMNVHYQVYQTLTEKIRQKAITTAEVCQLAQACASLGLEKIALQYWQQVVKAKDLAVEDAQKGCIFLIRRSIFSEAYALFKRVPEEAYGAWSDEELALCASIVAGHKESERAIQLLNIALTRHPKSPSLWINVALFYYDAGNEQYAYHALQQAIACGATEMIQKDAAVMKIYLNLMSRYGQGKGL